MQCSSGLRSKTGQRIVRIWGKQQFEECTCGGGTKRSSECVQRPTLNLKRIGCHLQRVLRRHQIRRQGLGRFTLQPSDENDAAEEAIIDA